ncbi:MAG TPA: sodium:solute symporter [Candidatus Polarisedimenticolaceae bacterium]|nr:sodium:solute symporter [Candidatus Polarisedimenticolaceae bacterium]
MSGLDWAVLVGTIALVVSYGAWKTRGARDMASYFRGDYSLRWPTIGLSIMATQASAITFLSTPGQGFQDGMRFVQFYFGLPLAMIVIAAVFVPIYHKLKVVTAYEYLESRFDVRVRYLGALLFLLQRGLAAGITIYAPAIILSTILGWPLQMTILALGAVVIVYTVVGGTAMVSETQKHQMVVMMGGLAVALGLILSKLPAGVTTLGAVRLAGVLGHMNVVDFHVDPNTRYTFWSGITGGFFLAMAYFGTDQSQVGRYLSGRSVTESRLGLLFNGLFKVPMQFVILFIGVMVFVFYLFVRPPVFFNAPVLAKVAAGPHGPELAALEHRYDDAFEAQRAAATAFASAGGQDRDAARTELQSAAARAADIRAEAKALIKRASPETDTKDTDYVFLSFVLRYVPSGLVGLLLAAILCASMSATSSELSALGSTTTSDFFKRLRPRASTPHQDLVASKLFTAAWGVIAISFANVAGLIDNLIQAVNILGSIFYGTMLGLFAVAFFVKRVSATPVLIAAVVAQVTVLVLFFTSDIGFLWYNVIGCGIVVVLSSAIESIRPTAP